MLQDHTNTFALFLLMGSYAMRYAQAWSQSGDQTATGGLIQQQEASFPLSSRLSIALISCTS